MCSLLFAIILSASIDSTTIMLGDQTDLHYRVTCAPDEKVAFPQYGEILIEGVEIVDRTIIDTICLSDGRQQYDQYLTLTSFKDSLFYIPPQAFVCQGDTQWTDALSLNVIQPFEIDTADQAITDIKPVMKAPFWWWGTLRWVLLGLLIAGLGVGIYFLVRYLRRHPVSEENLQPKEPERPAEEIALEELDKIKQEKIWQTGQTKQYHSQLTSVVREYIGRRFDVHSTEKTSDETLRELKPLLSEQKDLFLDLKKMLQLADLVKFAKWHTTPDENEQALQTAYNFVNQTTHHDIC